MTNTSKPTVDEIEAMSAWINDELAPWLVRNWANGPAIKVTAIAAMLRSLSEKLEHAEMAAAAEADFADEFKAQRDEARAALSVDATQSQFRGGSLAQATERSGSELTDTLQVDSQGAQPQGEPDPVPQHHCEFLTDPERGRCEGHEMFAAGVEYAEKLFAERAQPQAYAKTDTKQGVSSMSGAQPQAEPKK